MFRKPGDHSHIAGGYCTEIVMTYVTKSSNVQVEAPYPWSACRYIHIRVESAIYLVC
jgi:hypothetical protein